MKSIFSGDTKFARFMNKVGDIILLSILWIVCCIPIITMGASTTAAYYAAAKVIRHNTGYEWNEFFKSFRLNFKSTIGMNLVFVICVAFLAFNFIVMGGANEELFFYLKMVYIVIGVLLIGVYAYAYPIMSRFNLKGGKIMLMSLQLFFRHFPTTMGIVGLFFLTVFGMYMLPWAFFILPGLFMFTVTFLMERILLKYMPKPEEGSEEAERWYFQPTGRILKSKTNSVYDGVEYRYKYKHKKHK